VRAQKAETTAKTEAARAQKAETNATAETKRAQEAEAREKSQRESAVGKAEALAAENKNYQSLSLSNHIKELLPNDPELSLSLALAATKAWPSFSHTRYGLRSAFVTWPEKHFVLRDQGTSVERAIFTNDGQIIRTGQIAGTTGTVVKVWNVAVRKDTWIEPGHDRGTAAIAVSKDSTRLATEGADGTGRIWFLKDRVYKVLEGLTGPSAAIAFNHNGKFLATEGTVDILKAGWAIFIWDADDRQHLTNATPLLRLVGHKGAVTALDFSPTEDDLATASEDMTVRIWDAKTGDLKNILTGHTARINSVAFDRTGSRIVTASNDGTSRVWDKLTGKELITLRGHLGKVTKATFSSDGQQILTLAESKEPGLPEDNLVRIWNAASGALRLNVGGHTKQITDASFSNNGRMIVTASKDGTAQLWDAGTGMNLMAFKGHSGPISNVEFSPDDKSVLTSGTDNTAQVWRIPADALETQFFFARKMIPELGPDFGPIDIDFHSDERIVTIGTDGWVKSWDPRTLKENKQESTELPIPAGVPALRASYLSDIERSPDGRYVAMALRAVPTDPASIKASSIARVWDRVKQSYIELIPEPGASVGADTEISKVKYSPKGKYLLTASKNGAAVLWDTATWKAHPIVVEPLPNDALEHSVGSVSVDDQRSARSPGAILTAAFDDTEQWVVTGHQSGALEVFRTADGKNAFVKATAHRGRVLSIAFSRDNKLIITGSADGTAAVWEFDKELLASDLQEKKGEAVRIVTPIPHTRPVIDARFSYDGNFIVTACADNTVRVWENPTSVLVAEFNTLDTPWSAELSPDNKHLAVGGLDGFGEVFACEACRPFEVLKAEAIQRKPRELTKLEEDLLQLEGEKIKETKKNN
jgi:WD40 repeat protein